MFVPFIVHAEEEKLIDHIQTIADNAGGDNTSINIIGDTGLAYDGTDDNNLRYIGRDPNNYVMFNGELWRIVGIMNNIEDEEGNSASRVKIMRYEAIGEYSWGPSPVEINNGWGDNEWTFSNMYKILEGYYSGEKVLCYTETYEETECDFTDMNLSNKSKKMIITAKWNLGAHSAPDFGYTLGKIYKSERANYISHTCTAPNCHDTGFEGSVRKPIWVGNVGLIYPSDYGYATSGANNDDKRTSCLNGKYIFNVGSSNWADFSECHGYTWVETQYSENLFTMNPYRNDYYGVMTIFQGHILEAQARAKGKVKPVVYLKDGVYIYSGDGTLDNPYVLGGYNVIVESEMI